MDLGFAPQKTVIISQGAVMATSATSPYRMNSARLITTFIVVQLLTASLGCPLAYAGQHATPEEMVDALNGVFGKQKTNRAVHAKGVVLTGTFTPSADASSLSKAPHLQTTSVPITVRFSDFAGIPTIPDTDGLASPRGMAIKFKLPDDSETDLVTHSFNGFPTPTTGDFRELLIAIAASGPKAAKPTALDKYLGAHPIAKTFLTTQKGPPESYATLSYFGVNSFKFTSAKGESEFGRYQIIPEAGEHLLDKDAVVKAEPNYLIDEIGRRVSAAPVKFKLRVQLAEKGDKIDDPSIAWPDSRKIVELGELVIDKTVADDNAEEQSLLFLPTALPDGIEPADPMLTARSEAYPVSYARRHQ